MPSPETHSPAESAADAASTRARLLTVARRIFAEKNLEGASVREIASAAGQNVAAISYHFGGKEGLYIAVLDGVITELRSRVDGTLQAIAQRHDRQQLDPDSARSLLKQLFAVIIENAIARGDDMFLERLIVREQTQPTAAFDVLYDRGMKMLHETIARLIAITTGEDPLTERTIIRAHALLGQALGFIIARETIRRRLDRPRLTADDAHEIILVLHEHIDLILLGLQHGRAKP